MPQNLGRVARAGGLALALLSCVYLANVYRSALDDPGYEALHWPAPGIWLSAVVLCTLAMAMVAVGWYVVVRASSGRASFASAFVAFALAQPAKYLPGNVWHLATRHALGRADGHGHTSLIFASGLEAASLIGVALVLVAVLGLPVTPVRTAWITTGPFMLAGLGLLAAASAWAMLRGGFRSGLWLVLHLFCSVGYFACAALAFWLLADVSVQSLPPQSLLAALALAWVAGFVVIGAPGGIGVREALIVQLLSGTTSGASLLESAMAWRVCTVVGDALLFALAWLGSKGSPVIETD